MLGCPQGETWGKKPNIFNAVLGERGWDRDRSHRDDCRRVSCKMLPQIKACASSEGGLILPELLLFIHESRSKLSLLHGRRAKAPQPPAHRQPSQPPSCRCLRGCLSNKRGATHVLAPRHQKEGRGTAPFPKERQSRWQTQREKVSYLPERDAITAPRLCLPPHRDSCSRTALRLRKEHLIALHCSTPAALHGMRWVHGEHSKHSKHREHREHSEHSEHSEHAPTPRHHSITASWNYGITALQHHSIMEL